MKIPCQSLDPRQSALSASSAVHSSFPTPETPYPLFPRQVFPSARQNCLIDLHVCGATA
jgi:hypothetical protein